MTDLPDSSSNVSRALVIEDDELVRASIVSILRKADFVVVEAKDGNEGLKRYAERPADVVITDILMPNKEGIETIIELRRLNARLKIIAISGGGRIGSGHLLDLAKKMGADQVLAKPFTPAALLRTVSNAWRDSQEQPGPAQRNEEAVTMKARILVVDDNRFNQVVSAAVLEKCGYAFDVVDNGEKAVNAVASGEYCVVLMDIHMPEMDGMEATRLIRAMATEKRYVPIIAVSAHPSCDELFDAGIDDYIAKPINTRTLIGKIEYWRRRSSGYGQEAQRTVSA